MAILFLILRVLTAIFGAVIFTILIVISKEFWEYDKLSFVIVILADVFVACLMIFVILI